LTLRDAIGREVAIPKNITHILCVGPGCLRYLAYLQKTDYTLTNNPAERYISRSGWLPYLVSNPELRNLPSIQTPVYPAQIQTLTPKPDVIVMMNASGPFSPDDLSRMTDTPIIVLHEGDLVNFRGDLDYSLRILGLLTGSSDRAEEVIRFFDKLTDNLRSRVSTIPEFQHKVAYIGGYTIDTPRAILTTTADYLPFELVKVNNAVHDQLHGENNETILKISRDSIKKVNPDAIFVDLSTLAGKQSGITELEDIPEFADIPAIRTGEVYGLFPTEIYGQNHEADLINAYGIGKVLYPDKFIDVDPKTMAEYILTFLYNKPIFEDVNKDYSNLGLTRIPVFT
ncbi:MAG: ABC transporter substrate-binding protein, partial [Methanospirillum sp.]|nr:ABC transporter substrate-binding protein [Methanospirillum sp.]